MKLVKKYFYHDQEESKDTYNYKGWLNSDYFYKRVLAVFGYSTIIPICFYAAIFLLYWIVGVSTRY